jgi:hypothetical protein
MSTANLRDPNIGEVKVKSIDCKDLTIEDTLTVDDIVTDTITSNSISNSGGILTNSVSAIATVSALNINSGNIANTNTITSPFITASTQLTATGGSFVMDNTVTTISNDSTDASKSSTKLITEGASKLYVDGLIATKVQVFTDTLPFSSNVWNPTQKNANYTATVIEGSHVILSFDHTTAPSSSLVINKEPFTSDNLPALLQPAYFMWGITALDFNNEESVKAGQYKIGAVVTIGEGPINESFYHDGWGTASELIGFFGFTISYKNNA